MGLTRLLRLSAVALAFGTSCLLAAANPPAALPPAVAPAPAPVVVAAPGCAGPDCKVTVTKCVCETEKTTKTHTAYRCKCKTICLPFHGACKQHGDGCTGCEQSCGKVRQVRVLVKKFVKEEHCEVKCKPKEVRVDVDCGVPCVITSVPATPASTPPAFSAPQRLANPPTLIPSR